MDSQASITYQNQPLEHAAKMQGYYRLHAYLYDWTRWSFLFGRRRVLDWLPFHRADKITVMEIGCGTGHNLKALASRYYKAKLIGVDISADMLDVADKKLAHLDNALSLQQKAYGTEGVSFGSENKKADVVLFSYCLTMVNPNWENLIQQAKQDLAEGGMIAVVDFHDSPWAWFKKWMGLNHVRMDAHLLPFLEAHFKTVKLEKRKAYGGLWQYFVFIGA
jgi:S-adenosylmethionine-diacylgycerolhomoserine-N-methlytransferase